MHNLMFLYQLKYVFIMTVAYEIEFIMSFDDQFFLCVYIYIYIYKEVLVALL